MKTIHTLASIAAAATLGIGAPLCASDSDDQIAATCSNSYTFKTLLTGNPIGIIARNGVVTLTGQVDQETDKYLAQETVVALPGVKGLNNRLSVSPKVAEKSDAGLQARVSRILGLHCQGARRSPQVDIEDGVITLSGVATSEAQRERVSECATDIPGVSRVTNAMTLNETPAKPAETVLERIDDASVTAQVKLAFISHRSTATLRAGVRTVDGIVTLSGLATNAAEKALATKVGTDINGVRCFVNNMIIAATAPGSGVKPRPVLNLRVVTTGN